MKPAIYELKAQVAINTPRTLREVELFAMINVLFNEIDNLEEAKRENTQLRQTLRQVDIALRVPAAEYVPALRDVFTVLDRCHAAH